VIDPDIVRTAFRQRHGGEPRLFAAPGRVNLIGEHTDYNDGFVLPMAIDRGVVVAGRARPDRRVTVRSLDLDAEASFELDRPGPPRRGQWSDYVEGVAQALLGRGVALGGADLVLSSDVPHGAGLSSSAALELAVGLALSKLAGQEVDGVGLALAGQTAEHTYVGTMCGIMDQLIAALGRAGHALLIDCRHLEPSLVPLALGGARIVIVDTRVKHDLATSAYNQRRAECERGVELLRAALPGVRALRDVSPGDLARHGDLLPEPVRRRCRHVVGENARTVAAADALRRGDLATVGRLMAASHVSLRDDHEVSCAELDLLAELAATTAGVIGGRMTGGGFGGCTVNLVEAEAIERFAALAGARFTARFGRPPEVFVSDASDGARELEVA
jgi:galactokinase